MPKRKIYSVEQFIEEQSEGIQEVIISLHDLFMSYPNVSCKIRYNIPFYDYTTWVCYLNPVRKGDAVEVVFLNGIELKNLFPFLLDKGRKMVAGIEVDSLEEGLLENLVMVWEEAMAFGSRES